MPEGDTIHKLASALAPRLVGRRLVRFRARHDPELDLAGRLVEGVRAHGKHLFVALDGGLELRSHLGMHGSWHRYAPGERWKRPERQASLVLATDEDVLVCFLAAEVELLRAGSLRARDVERGLGPDLAADGCDLDEVLLRARARVGGDTLVVDVLLDQRVAAGIGNVYKSEVLFLEEVAPRTPAAVLDDGVLRRLYERARELLRANLRGGPRVTRPQQDGAGELWVYRRAGRPCHRCAAPIATQRLGRGRRSTYWCPRCQPEGRRE